MDLNRRGQRSAAARISQPPVSRASEVLFMATSQLDACSSAPDTTQTLKRRGLFAAGAALVAGLIAKLSEQSVSAGVDGDVVLGVSNSTTGATEVRCTAANGAGLIGTCLSGASGIGVNGQGSRWGVLGLSIGTGSAGAGVFGEGAANSAGVYGENNDGVGVQGWTLNNYAVFGQIPAFSSSNTIAIYAQNYSTYAGAGPGAGGFAIYGLCAKGHGLVGATATAGGAAVVGATNGVAGAYAGAFYGPVIIGGALTVVGGPKSAAVPHPDGSHRRMYCLESPESWFEDFGKGQLECGRAAVSIDPDFAAVVHLDDYQVFLTEYDQHSDLCVTDRTPVGFRVQARDAAADGQFGWRIVAKRKDITSERLATVTIPPEPTLPPPVPDTPMSPPPDLRRRR
jgi:hypothetical protein